MTATDTPHRPDPTVFIPPQRVLAVIPTSGRNIRMLRQCLQSLHRAASDTILRVAIVVCPDDEKAAASIRSVIKKGETLLRLPPPFSFAHSNNAGLSLLKNEEFVLFLNDDCFFRGSGDLKRLINTLRLQEFAYVGPWIHHRHHVAELPPERRTNGIVRSARPLIGACLLWDRSWLDRTGRFDETFDGYGMEEADLSLRVLRIGGRWGRDDRIRVDHLHHATFGSTVKDTEPHQRNLRCWAEKHPGIHSWGEGKPWTDNATDTTHAGLEEVSDPLAHIATLRNTLRTLEYLHLSMIRSRSWRWTAWMRKVPAVRHSMGSRLARLILAQFKRGWIALGEPFPDAIRFIRHMLIGRFVPAIPQETSASDSSASLTPSVIPQQWTDEVAVVIPCHNLGRFLGETVESVLSQHVRPRQILIVDDASTDDTPNIAALFAGKGVRYMRGEWKNVSFARNAGAGQTEHTPYLLFLDADDILPPEYIDVCLREARGKPDIAIVYGDMQQFGASNTLYRMPEFDPVPFDRTNIITSHALILRQAFELVGGYRTTDAPGEDWDMYRRILQMPFRAKKAPTHVLYRVRPESRYHSFIGDPSNRYSSLANLRNHPLTIFTPFAGRWSVFDRYLDALQRLECNRSMIRLHWYNTSTDASFDERLRMEIGRLPFGQVTYTHDPLPESWGLTPKSLIRNRLTRIDAGYFYELAVVRAYNFMIKTCSTDLVLTLEDDIAPAPDALQRMFDTMAGHVAAVVAPYDCPIRGYTLVWNRNEHGYITHVPERRTGIEEVDGSGFGCSLLRMTSLRQMPVYTRFREKPQEWYDQVVFSHVQRQGTVLCNWDVQVEHLPTERYKEAPVLASAQDEGNISL